MTQAQETSGKFFVYIQDQGGSPFYLRDGDSLLSSSPSGYLIIPGLAKGSYKFTIGFPRNEAPEASFNVTLDGSGDKGFLLRKDGNGLLNLYRLKDFKPLAPTAVASAPGNRIVDVPAETPPAPKPGRSASTAEQHAETAASAEVSPASAQVHAQTPGSPDDSDAFSRMLNEITGTTTPAAASAPVSASASSEKAPEAGVSTSMPAAEPPQPTVSGEDTGSLNAVVGQAAPLPDQPPTAGGEVVAKPGGSQQPEFITFQPDSVPAPVGRRDTEASAPAYPPVEADADSLATVRRQERKLRKQQRRAEKAAGRESSAEAEGGLNAPSVAIPVPSGPEPAAPATQMDVPRQEGRDTARTYTGPLKVNSDCRQIISSEEFQKVRRKMASRSDEDGMFRIAKKSLAGGSCFMTDQIQSLTYLFLTDEYKYKFLELAYPHIADPANFGKLAKTLGTDYYRKRFDAMIR